MQYRFMIPNDQNVYLCVHYFIFWNGSGVLFKTTKMCVCVRMIFLKQVLCFIKMHFLQVPVVAYCNTVYMYCFTKHVIKTNDALINWCWNFKNRTNVCSFCYVSLGKKKKITHRIVNDKEKKEKNDKEKIGKYNA